MTSTTTTTTRPGDEIQFFINGILPRIDRLDEILRTPSLRDQFTDAGLAMISDERSALVQQVEAFMRGEA